MSSIFSIRFTKSSLTTKLSSDSLYSPEHIKKEISESANKIAKALSSSPIDTTESIHSNLLDPGVSAASHPRNNVLFNSQRQLQAERDSILIRLNQLQKTFPPVAQQLPSSIKAEVNQHFLDNLHKELSLHQNTSPLGQVYQAVIEEECDVQDKQTEEYKKLAKRRDSSDNTNNTVPYSKENDFSHLAKGFGEIQFLNHKLAIIDYCQKVNELYITSDWQPNTKTINKIQLLTASKKNDNTKELSRNELSNLAAIISSKSEIRRDYLKEKTAKVVFKYFPLYTPVYILNIGNIRALSNKRLENQKNKINDCNKKIEELFGTKSVQKKDIEQLFLDTLQKPISGEHLLEKQLEIYHEIPTVSSIRGTDHITGLYHEKQFHNSGTCLLHANNHYLAARHAEQGKPFLALTPKRMELLINGMVNQKRANINYVASMNLSSHRKTSNFTKIFNAQDKGLRSVESKYHEYKKNLVSNYNYGTSDLDDKYAIKDTSALTKNVGTGDLGYSGILTFLNSTFGCNKLTSEMHQAWEYGTDEYKNVLVDMMKNSNQIRFSYHYVLSGHAMCFSKQNEQWYLQDSHFDSPIPCTPLELIEHMNRNDNPGSALNNIRHSGGTTSFRSHHDLSSSAELKFGYYS